MDDTKREPVHFDDEIFLRGETFYYRGTPPGRKKQIEFTLKIKKGAAQKDVLRAKRNALDGFAAVGTRAGKNAFDHVANQYLKERHDEATDENILSKHTADEASGILNNHMIPYFGNKRLEEFEQADFEEYCKFKKKKLNLVNHRKVINHFFKWAVSKSYLKYRPEFVIPKTFQKERRPRVVLTESEIKKLIENSEGKILLYVMMYLFMGMRNMEILRLRWDEVDFERRGLKINKFSNRRRKERAIPINEYVLSLLAEAYKTKVNEYVFPSPISTGKASHISPSGGIRKPWFNALAKAGIDRHITPHDLRATFEKFMHTNKSFTDTQREKMAGASIDVQKNIYITMDVEDLRGLEESVQIPGFNELIRAKFRANEDKSVVKTKTNKRKLKGKSK